MALDDLQPRDVANVSALSAGELVLQRVLLDRPAAVRPLYWRVRGDRNAGQTGVQPDGAGGLRIKYGTTITFDTYFGAVFERAWRLYTGLGSLTLSLELAGRATLRIFRRLPGTPSVLLHEADLVGPTRVTLPAESLHHRQAGLVWFELTAGEGSVVLSGAEWSTSWPAIQMVRLGLVICTFNREEPLADVLGALAADPGLDAVLGRVIVVNQGTPGLRSHLAVASTALALGERLRVVEQPNFGGAGGFGRGLIEALDDPAVSHVCFLDDDVRIEPESLRRMAAFFALADHGSPIALGGHMLDGIRATTLYEAGAKVLPNWALEPVNHGLDLRLPGRLLRLLETEPMHYNGWWMFGFDKRLIEQVGMPLPCFIRGDDVEFGMRLHEQGVPTVALPGVAIWHEPFYLKIGSWQLYYETRNALIAAALHQDFSRRHVAAQVLKRLLIHLLTYRYYNAALIVRAVQDFREGPSILDRDPRPLHAALAPLRVRWPDGVTRRERVLADAPVGRSPLRRAGFVAVLLWAILRNWMRPSRADTVPRRLLARDLVWFRVMGADCLAVDTYWDRDLPTCRRDRASFRTLLAEGLREIWDLARAVPKLRRDWREASVGLTSVEFWRAYLERV